MSTDARTIGAREAGAQEETPPAPGFLGRAIGRGRVAGRVNLAGALGTVLGSLGAPGSILLTLFLLEGLRAEKWQIGLVMTMTFLGPTFEPLGAYLVERLGRRRPLFLVSFLCNRIPFFALALLPWIGTAQGCRALGIRLVLLTVAVTRVACHLGTPAWWSWVGDLVPARRRAPFFGYRAQSASAATAASLLVGLALLEALGGMANRALVSALFTAGALFGVADILLYIWVPEPKRPDETTPASRGRPSFLREFRAPFHEARFRRLILGMGLWSFSANLIIPFLPVYQRGEMLAGQRLGLGISLLYLAGLNVVANLATMASSRLWAGRAQRFGPRPLLLVGSGYLFVNLAYWGIGPAGTALLIPVACVAGVLTGAWTVGTNQLLLGVAPSARRSFFVSAYNFTNGWLMASGPFLGGLLADHLPVLGWRLPGGQPCCYFHLLVLLACAGGAAALVLLAGVPTGHQPTPIPKAEPAGQVIQRRVRLLGKARRRSGRPAVDGDADRLYEGGGGRGHRPRTKRAPCPNQS